MSKLSITRRLSICFAAIMVVALILATSSLFSIATLSASLDRAVTSGAQKIYLTGKLLRDTTDMDASQRTLAWRTSLRLALPSALDARSPSPSEWRPIHCRK